MFTFILVVNQGILNEKGGAKHRPNPLVRLLVRLQYFQLAKGGQYFGVVISKL